LTRKRLLMIISGIALLLVTGYLAGGTLVYNQLTLITAKCGGKYTEHTPINFKIAQFDSAPYLMKSYEDVSFSSRDAAVSISAWYVPARDGAESAAPAVIVAHGHNSCKRSPSSLLAAGMLNRNGFNVLLIDLRNHGNSTIDNGRYAGGTKEYRDVLGAWDWLVNTKHIPEKRIGLVGHSLGAATVIIAMGEEPRVAATWEDSSYADISVAIQAELRRNSYPTILAPAGVLIGKVISGDDLGSPSPLGEIAKLKGRPLFITHGDSDTRLSVQYAYDLAEAIHAQGGQVEPWIVKGADHVMAMFNQPDDYEKRMAAFFKATLAA